MAKRKKQKVKLSGLRADGSPNAYWTKFKSRLDKYDSVPVSEWSDENFLGHILKRYKDYVGIEYGLSHSGPPTKCREIYCVRRMLISLGSYNKETVKKYIDWVFDTFVIPKNVVIDSMAYFFTSNFILGFKKELRRMNRITRATELPVHFTEIATKLDVDVKTYGDLAFAKIAITDDPSNEELCIYFKLFDELKRAGFDDSILRSLEG